jgi:hypothetical protein
LFEDLSSLSSDEDDTSPTNGALAAGSGDSNSNWLGKAYSKEGSAADGWQDSDGDGFSDSKEESASSDPRDATSVPSGGATGQLDLRLRSVDPDMDGLTSEDEVKRGTNPQSSDSDGDGKPDGAEVLSMSDPLVASNDYVDTDNDGLSDAYEQTKGTNPKGLDSDSDGLRDDLEIVVGSNPTRIDSDGDGISDGKEFDLGSDPLLGEPDKAAPAL